MTTGVMKLAAMSTVATPDMSGNAISSLSMRNTLALAFTSTKLFENQPAIGCLLLKRVGAPQSTARHPSFFA